MTIVRMMLSRGTVSSRSRSNELPAKEPNRDHDHQDRQAGLQVGVDEAHRQQRRRKRAERAQPDDVAQQRRDQRRKRQQQQDLHDLVHRDGQSPEIQDLDRMPLAGHGHLRSWVEAVDRKGGANRRLVDVAVGNQDFIAAAADGQEIRRIGKAVSRIKRHPRLAQVGLHPNVRLHASEGASVAAAPS